MAEMFKNAEMLKKDIRDVLDRYKQLLDDFRVVISSKFVDDVTRLRDILKLLTESMDKLDIDFVTRPAAPLGPDDLDFVMPPANSD
ncbi:unnamed protein product [Arabis nemorensis]|uniref:Uncharacterized protein n=1 Tax=Arabis nemorensis TaxID=586526 RepID=A0A565CFV4_9BRAS|nr:unnamed protein product [Arabis nemorensis]